MNQSASEKLKKALRQDELFDYMVGAKGYDYTCPYADTPTYDEVVFVSINEYSKQNNDSSVWPRFEKAWLDMSADPSYSWFALYYLFLYLRNFPNPEAEPIRIKKMLPLLIANIRKTRTALSHDQRWMGRGLPRGLWDNATRMAAIINREFGLDIRLE